MEARYGTIFCSAPTDVAVDNFASRLDRRSIAVTERCNKGKRVGDTTPRRSRKLVVRCYPHEDECWAFDALLRDPKRGDDAAPSSLFSDPSNWKLHLSSAFWLLVILRSPHVRELHQDDPKVLHNWRKKLDERTDLDDFRAVVLGEMTWEAWSKTEKFSSTMLEVDRWIEGIPMDADILCATPEASENDKRVQRFKLHAGGVAIDEVANMTRADLMCVWGNTLTPCFVFGDPKQLPPTVMTVTDKFPRSNDFINRFVLDAKISALECLQASGMPVYRLKTQLTTSEGEEGRGFGGGA
jgi:hypothetical protein